MSVADRRELRRTLRIAGFGVVTAGMVPAFLAKRAMDPRARSDAMRDAERDRWVGAWCSAVLGMFGIEVLARGAPPGGPGGRLVVSNHRSTADILVLLRAFGGRMVSRADIGGWPLIGTAAKVAGTVFVDRKDAASGATAVRSMLRYLAGGSPVIVFPEGTTFPDDEVRPFHGGAFVAAVRARAKVVPVGLAYARGSGAAFVGESFTKHLARMAGAERSRMAMCIGAPIEVAATMRAAALRDRAHAEVERLVREAREVVDG